MDVSELLSKIDFISGAFSNTPVKYQAGRDGKSYLVDINIRLELDENGLPILVIRT